MNDLLTELTAQPLLDMATLRSALVFAVGVIGLWLFKALTHGSAALYRWANYEPPLPPPPPLGELAQGILNTLGQPGWVLRKPSHPNGLPVAALEERLAHFNCNTAHFMVDNADVLHLLPILDKQRVQQALGEKWAALAQRDEQAAVKAALAKMGLRGEHASPGSA